MNGAPTPEYLNGLVTELRKLPTETGWVEFKVGNTNPEEIGEYLSALSNTAAIQGMANGYVIWGVTDVTNAGAHHGASGNRAQRGPAKRDLHRKRGSTPLPVVSRRRMLGL